MATAAGTSVARPLKTLVPLIREELEAGDSAGIEHYRRAGEMLIEAKEQVGHGDWRGWVDRNFHLSQSQAARYMKLVEVHQNTRHRAFSTITEALGEQSRDARRGPAWHEPVQQIASRVNREALAKDTQDRAREAQLLHKLGHQLIDIGYKVLAAKLHPDKGGSTEAMTRLNKIRKTLKEAI